MFAQAQPNRNASFSAPPSGVPVVPPPGIATPQGERNLSEWLARTHEASKRKTFQGTFVVNSAFGTASAKIWHVCDGNQQMEKVEALTGPARVTLRQNQQVMTFMPDTRTVRAEQRETLGIFAALQPQSFAGMGEYYAAKTVGTERVAGVDTEIVQLTPRDQLRFGYRVWTEAKTGLVVKVQTLDEQARVLEQAAFSDLQINAPVRMDALSAQMKNTAGYKVERDELVKTTAAAEGWGMRSMVPGYRPSGCHKRLADSASDANPSLQWVFTDGLATVSLFIEPFDAKRHKDEAQMGMGATNTLTRRLEQNHWLVAMGEVPMTTLRAFASALYRR